jgi:uncharacterized protein DUF2071
MMLRTKVRDCLYLNWALPAAALPEPPSPLRYQLHASPGGEDAVFASALLFHQEGLRLDGFPLPRLSYPQCNLRLHVLDADGIPSVLFRCMLMPPWMAPGARLVTHQPVAAARLDLPRPSRHADRGAWTWRVSRVAPSREAALEVHAAPGSPQLGPGPRLGTWEETVDYFQERPRGYVEEDGRDLHRIASAHPRVPAWPLRAELGPAGLLGELLPLASGFHWPGLHSCFLCPEIPFVFELGLVPRVAMAPGLPSPAASSRSAVRPRRDVAAAARQGNGSGARPCPEAEEGKRAEPRRVPAEVGHGV